MANDKAFACRRLYSGQVAISDQGAALGKAIKDGRTDRAADRIEADKEAARPRGALELVDRQSRAARSVRPSLIALPGGA